MIDVPIAFHVTPPSITSLPNVVGHVGSVAAELAAAGCTASNKKFVIFAGDARFQLTKSAYPVFLEVVPDPAPIDTLAREAPAGAVPVTDTCR
jgi:hypothetical protein